ncbi:MAG TPA: dihydropyrimidinase, partial [Anaerostipes hadrus]|nr:dihydropyrimidinase [Anaerostipes hadrus]
MKEFDLIIKNGTVVTSTESFLCDVAVKDGKIAAMAQNIEADAKEIYDAAGKLVLPGALDAHTHMAMPFGGTVSADSYMAGTRAAACGGVTTIFDYPVQHKGETIRGLVNSKKEVLEKEACVDYAMHCCITDLNEGEILEEMEKAVAEGITSFKCFLVYKKEGMMVDDGMLARLMLRAKELGAMINIHAENPDLIDYYTEKFLSEGKTSAWYHYMSRPEFVEAEADKRAVHWAKHLDAPLYLVHMADKEGLEACIEAKEEGADVFVETCPQYLLLDDSVYAKPDFQGAVYVCAPPIRKKEDQDCLWEALSREDIQTVATDQCSFTLAQKALGKDDFTKIPGGLPGVQTRGTLLYTYGVKEGRITQEQMCKLLSENPAKLYGVYPQKGVLAPESDADIVVLDPEKESVISAATHAYNTDNNPFEGFRLR